MLGKSRRIDVKGKHNVWSGFQRFSRFIIFVLFDPSYRTRSLINFLRDLHVFLRTHDFIGP